jgi:hypothetical protein
MGKRKKKRSRRAQLVFQHLENVSRTALEQYLPIIGTYVRRKQGIYALYRKGALYYVGLAANLIGRLKGHLKDRHADTWDRFSVYLTKSDKHLKELETLALHTAKPRGNKSRGHFVRSDDLRNRFRHDLRQWMKDVLVEILSGQGAPETGPSPARQASRTLRKYVTRKLRLRMWHKGKTYYGSVREDGMVRCGKGLFKSPSGAAHAVTRSSVDGWFTWEYQTKDGEWVALDNLRKK